LAFRRELCSADRFSDAAIFFGSCNVNTPRLRSSASLSRLTRCDHRFGEAVRLREELRAGEVDRRFEADGASDLRAGLRADVVVFAIVTEQWPCRRFVPADFRGTIGSEAR
jgi:hypothetical protein